MKKILLIEDNTDIRETTAEILQLARYNVITAANGKEGVKLAQSELPDLIVCDIMMPELDGYGVLHMLGKAAATSSIPFIFLSAKTEKADMRKGMSLGADDYLTKPFENTELLNAIEARLKKSEQYRSDFNPTADGLNEFFTEAKGEDSLKELSDKKEIRHYKKKDNLYMEGSYPRGIFFITKGKVKVGRTNEDGKEYVTGLYKEGDFIGFTSLIEGSEYIDSAMAIEDTEAVIIPKDEFFALLYTNRDVAAKFIRMLSGNVAEMQTRLLQLAYNSVRKRVAETLLMLQKRYSREGENLSMVLAREDLAGMAGTSTETAVRTLTDFKDEGLIAVSGSLITILNPDKLSKMKN
jgi:CRP/FNR family transcriptional regulator, polysaccharide utilization system transcription regulator